MSSVLLIGVLLLHERLAEILCGRKGTSEPGPDNATDTAIFIFVSMKFVSMLLDGLYPVTVEIPRI